MKTNFGCPVQGTINVLSGKWRVLVVWHLGFMPRRFAEIRKLLPGVSEKVLTAQLRQLEKDGRHPAQHQAICSAASLIQPEQSWRRTHPHDDRAVPLGHSQPRHPAQSPHDPQSLQACQISPRKIPRCLNSPASDGWIAFPRKQCSPNRSSFVTHPAPGYCGLLRACLNRLAGVRFGSLDHHHFIARALYLLRVPLA